MPKRPDIPLDAAARLFRKLHRCTKQAVSRSGDINVSDLADCIERALDNEVDHRGIMLAIAEFIGTALDGATIDPRTWKPLSRLNARPPRQHR